ncbi:MAG: hypothetical protein CMI18_12000 [Opitutaceae bacterium]|nr:hypothetical protein [Opitutaceae bacterium]
MLTIEIRILRVSNTTLRCGFWIFDDEGTENGMLAVGELVIIHVDLGPVAQHMPNALSATTDIGDLAFD